MFTRKLDDDTLIRSYNIDDAPALHEVLKREHEHLLIWMPWPDLEKTLGDRREFIRGCIQQETDGDGFQTAILHRGELAGSVGFHGIDHANLSTSIGYWLAEKHQGKGIMTRACEALVDYALVDYALVELKLNRVRYAALRKTPAAGPSPSGSALYERVYCGRCNSSTSATSTTSCTPCWWRIDEVLRTPRGRGWSRPCPCDRL